MSAEPCSPEFWVTPDIKYDQTRTFRCQNPPLIFKAYWAIRKSTIGIEGTEALGEKKVETPEEK